MSALRKPAAAADDPLIAVRVPVQQEILWGAIRVAGAKGRSFAARDIHHATGAALPAAESYLLSLVRAGYVIKAGLTTAREPLYQALGEKQMPPLLAANGITAAGSVWLDHLWRAIRMAKSFTLTELAALVPDVPRDKAARYVDDLEQAGYLTRRGGAPDFWRLNAFSNTGSLPPRPMAARFIYDPNLRRIYNPGLTAERVSL